MLSLYVNELGFLAANKAGVVKALVVRTVAALAEVVHVQLAHEGAEVVVLEVLWEHTLGKLV